MESPTQSPLPSSPDSTLRKWHPTRMQNWHHTTPQLLVIQEIQMLFHYVCSLSFCFHVHVHVSSLPVWIHWFQALMTIDLLKQSAIPWCYIYSLPNQLSAILLVTSVSWILLFRWSSSIGLEDLFLILLWRRILYFFKPWFISGIKTMIKLDTSFK